jgi:hypothetical protein
MPKMDDEIKTFLEGGYGFVVRQENNHPAASFAFNSYEDARAAQKKMQEILAKCEWVTGHPPRGRCY